MFIFLIPYFFMALVGLDIFVTAILYYKATRTIDDMEEKIHDLQARTYSSYNSILRNEHKISELEKKVYRPRRVTRKKEVKV